MAKDATRDRFFAQMDRELARFIDPATGKVEASLLQEIPCPLCSRQEYDRLFVKSGLDFVRCRNCTFIYVNPRLKEDIILKGYTGNEEATSNRYWKDVLLSPAQMAFNDGAYGFLLDRVLEVRPAEGRLLDVGCSIGHFMELAKSRGFDVEGLELEKEALDYARGRGLTVHESLLEDMRYEDCSFDAVALLGLVEHVTTPSELIREVHRILKPGGILILNGVPNVASLAVMVLRERARMFNGRNHLGYYSPQTLHYLLTRHGFGVAHFSTYVSALDSMLNAGQFLDPFDDLQTTYLPDAFRDVLGRDRGSLENAILDTHLGYKMRSIAVKR